MPPYLQRLMWTPLLCLTPSMSTSTVVMGPTSHVKKAGVMRALSSAPHLPQQQYGRHRLRLFLSLLG